PARRRADRRCRQRPRAVRSLEPRAPRRAGARRGDHRDLADPVRGAARPAGVAAGAGAAGGGGDPGRAAARAGRAADAGLLRRRVCRRRVPGGHDRPGARGVAAMKSRSGVGWLVAVAALVAGCAWPPWQLGAPLDGRRSIPEHGAIPSPREARAAALAARAAGQPVLELQSLQVLDRSYRLDGDLRAQPTAIETARLAELLQARAAAFHALGRAVPESRDLESAARLDPTLGQALAATRALAAARGGVAPGTAGAATNPPPLPSPLPADLGAWVLSSPALSTRVLPL